MLDREQFVITIEDAGDRHSVPVAPRLRRLLKAMLRGYSFRCRDIRKQNTIKKTGNDLQTTEPN